ncbi:MAG: hypothetical protein ACHQNT_05775 [Bacteroidia bacterium]
MKLKIAGIVLIFIAIACFMTVADDLRHKGELAFAGIIMLSGVLLLIYSFTRKRKILK